jgi:hypothetical protein
MAARKDLVTHVLTVNGTKIGIDQSETDYASIGDIVGIKKATDSENVTAFMDVPDAQKNGLVVRLSCRLKSKKTNSILCAIDKVSSARASLRGKAMNGSTIATVRIPRKRSRR